MGTSPPTPPPGPDAREEALRALIAAGDIDRATDQALRVYGPELIGWLCSVLPADADAHEAFSRMSEELWRSLRRFDGRCSVRTWCYMLARHATSFVRGRPQRQRELLVSDIPSVLHAATHVWNSTVRREQHASDIYAAIRAQLDDEDQALLVLRVDRGLGWGDIAQILLGEAATLSSVEKKAATLRKQFERVKARLRELAQATEIT